MPIDPGVIAGIAVHQTIIHTLVVIPAIVIIVRTTNIAKMGPPKTAKEQKNIEEPNNEDKGKQDSGGDEEN